MRTCKICNKELPITDFRLTPSHGKLYRSNQCHTCLNELSRMRMKKIYESDKEKYTTRQKLYKKTPEQIERRKQSLNAWQKRREIENPEFRIRRRISSAIRKSLHKENKSINKLLPYSIQELKQHLEDQFEPWMNWKNYGPANKNQKTWQIDHIIPQSKLPYLSFADDNFFKCWALNNLRPLEAIANIKKGNKCIMETNKKDIK